MGTDIHIYAERFTDGAWRPLPIKVEDDRNYWAFAILANVRNGYGFGGCTTGRAVTPIAEPRGLPADTSIANSPDTVEYGDPEYCWLGDHSFSWVLLSELRAVDLNQMMTTIGVLSPDQAAKLDSEGILPTEWCGGTNQPGWVQRSWQRPLRVAAHLLVKILEQFKDEQEPEKVRLVFGFDS